MPASSANCARKDSRGRYTFGDFVLSADTIVANPPNKVDMAVCQPFVSVVIPAHGRADVLLRVLHALSQQSYTADRYEVVVVDDCSAQPLEEELTSAFAPFPSHIRIRFLRNPANLGDRRSRDKGVDAARGEAIILLDSDMIPNHDFIASHVKAHASDCCYAVTGHFRFPPELGRDLWNASSPRGREYRMRMVFPEAPIRGGATTANMSMYKHNYQRARTLADERLAKHSEFAETYNIYGWKDIEFMSALTLVGISLRYDFSAWAWHFDSEPFENGLRKALQTGVGVCRYAVLYPEKMEEVLTDGERAQLAGKIPAPTYNDLVCAWSHLMCMRFLERVGLFFAANRHGYKVRGFYGRLGLEVARHGGWKRLLHAEPLSFETMAALVEFVQRTEPKSSLASVVAEE